MTSLERNQMTNDSTNTASCDTSDNASGIAAYNSPTSPFVAHTSDTLVEYAKKAKTPWVHYLSDPEIRTPIKIAFYKGLLNDSDDATKEKLNDLNLDDLDHEMETKLKDNSIKVKVVEITKKIALQWKELTKEDKKPWEDKHTKEKEELLENPVMKTKKTKKLKKTNKPKKVKSDSVKAPMITNDLETNEALSMLCKQLDVTNNSYPQLDSTPNDSKSLEKEVTELKNTLTNQQKQIDTQRQEIDTLKQMFNTMSLSLPSSTTPSIRIL
jgi:hypothetical protein